MVPSAASPSTGHCADCWSRASSHLRSSRETRVIGPGATKVNSEGLRGRVLGFLGDKARELLLDDLRGEEITESDAAMAQIAIENVVARLQKSDGLQTDQVEEDHDTGAFPLNLVFLLALLYSVVFGTLFAADLLPSPLPPFLRGTAVAAVVMLFGSGTIEAPRRGASSGNADQRRANASQPRADARKSIAGRCGRSQNRAHAGSGPPKRKPSSRSRWPLGAREGPDGSSTLSA